MNRVIGLSLLGVMLVSPGDLAAQQAVDLGEFVVHYNALNTNQIPPQMTQSYRIGRSPNLGMLVVTVLKKELDGTETPIRGKVSSNTVNLTGQRRNLDMREISEAGGAVYYITTFRVYNLETISFTVNVEIDGLDEPAVIEFRQQFYTE